MRVIIFFESDGKEHWLNEIKRAVWSAAALLYELLRKGVFFMRLIGDHRRDHCRDQHIRIGTLIISS